MVVELPLSAILGHLDATYRRVDSGGFELCLKASDGCQYTGPAMYLQLDQQGHLHEQLIRAIKDAIMDGRLGVGERLPSTRDLAGDMGLSRNTVLAAYEQLRAEGCLDGKVGSGTFVADLRTAAVRAPVGCVSAQPSNYARRLVDVGDFWAGTRPPTLRYNLQYGEPLANPTLTSAWSRELARAARYTNPGYPQTPGLPELRQAVCDYLKRRRGVQADADDVLIVNGTQQALSLAARLLLDDGDVAVIEEPRYFGARRVFNTQGARVVGVRTDRDGLVCDDLPADGARVVFVTPSHQFPGGSVMSLPRRLALLRYAADHECWIIEDDYDGEFRYDVQPLAALRSMDSSDRVIYVGTFSKSLFPMLRLGYVVMPAGLRKGFIAAKWMGDLCSSAVDQAALAHFMVTGGFERHLRKAAKALKARRAALIERLRACSGDRIEVMDSHAGMHLVAWLRDLDAAQCNELIVRSRAAGVALQPIADHYITPPERPGLLLGYASISVVDIEPAVRLFGRCLDAIPPVKRRVL